MLIVSHSVLYLQEHCRNKGIYMKAELTSNEIAKQKSSHIRLKVWDTLIKGYYLLVLPSGNKSLYLYYRYNGKAHDYCIGKIGKYTAKTGRDEATRLSAKLTQGIDIQTDKKNKKAAEKRSKQATLKTFIETEYAPYVSSKLNSANEVIRVLNKDFLFLHDRKMDSITIWEMKKWTSTQLKNGLSPATVNRRIGVLKSMMSLAVESGVIEKNPLTGMTQLKIDTNQKVRYLEVKEENRLRKALEERQDHQREARKSHNKWLISRRKESLPELSNRFTDHLYPITLIALNTGMRRGELFKLDWSNVSLQQRIITVEGQTAKSKKTRHIPMNDEAFHALVTWRNQTESKGLVFSSPATGKKLDNISTAWNSLLNNANIKDFRFHDLRHNFASQLVMKGVDLLTIKELLGHSKLEMTLRYAHLAPEHKAAAVALLN